MFLCACLSICLSVWFFFFWSLDYSRTNEQVFLNIFLSVGPGQRKKLQIFVKDLDYILDTKKIMNFQVPFSMYF